MRYCTKGCTSGPRYTCGNESTLEYRYEKFREDGGINGNPITFFQRTSRGTCTDFSGHADIMTTILGKLRGHSILSDNCGLQGAKANIGKIRSTGTIYTPSAKTVLNLSRLGPDGAHRRQFKEGQKMHVSSSAMVHVRSEHKTHPSDANTLCAVIRNLTRPPEGTILSS